MFYSANPDSELTVRVSMTGTDDVVVANAELWIDGMEVYIARGSSRRDPQDAPNSETGVKLALGRAIRQLGREILKDGQDNVREAETVRRKQQEAALVAKFNKQLRAQVNREVAMNAYSQYVGCSCGDPECNWISYHGVSR